MHSFLVQLHAFKYTYCWFLQPKLPPPIYPPVPPISSTTFPKSRRTRGSRVQCSISQWQFSAVQNFGTIAGTIIVYWTNIMVDNNGQQIIGKDKYVTFPNLIPCILVLYWPIMLNAWCWTSSPPTYWSALRSHPRISDSSHPIWSYQTLYTALYSIKPNTIHCSPNISHCTIITNHFNVHLALDTIYYDHYSTDGNTIHWQIHTDEHYHISANQ